MARLTGLGPTSSGVGADVVAVVAAGGVLGTLARYGLTLLAPHPVDRIGWATMAVNVVGCLLMGALVTVAQSRTLHRLMRPFLGVGVLGGFTTFSAAVGDAHLLVLAGRPGFAAVVAAGTLVGSVVAVGCGSVLARRWVARR